MDKQWVENKNKEDKEKIESKEKLLISSIKAYPLLDQEQKEDLINRLQKREFYMLGYDMAFYPFNYISKNNLIIEKFSKDIKDKLTHWNKNVADVVCEIREYYDSLDYWKYYGCYGSWGKYLDSDPMEFDGDILITDPCYIMNKNKPKKTPEPQYKDFLSYNYSKDYPDYNGEESLIYNEEVRLYYAAKNKWDEENPEDWELCEYGENLEILGINHYMTRDTLYGDWSCTTYNTDTKEAIGRFCADAGLVSVFLLDEVLKYNPDYKDHIENVGIVTWIKDFKGTVQFVVKQITGVYEETTEYWNQGDPWEDFYIEVVGHGINKVTGEPINFVGTQTGL